MIQGCGDLGRFCLLLSSVLAGPDFVQGMPLAAMANQSYDLVGHITSQLKIGNPAFIVTSDYE